MNLPQDTEINGLLERLGKCGGKCGVIKEYSRSEPKVKMYREDETFSGGAFVVFFKEDSATLALNLMDGSELRLGDGSAGMRVQRADF